MPTSIRWRRRLVAGRLATGEICNRPAPEQPFAAMEGSAVLLLASRSSGYQLLTSSGHRNSLLVWQAKTHTKRWTFRTVIARLNLGQKCSGGAPVLLNAVGVRLEGLFDFWVIDSQLAGHILADILQHIFGLGLSHPFTYGVTRQESLGMGRLYDPGHRALPDQCSRRSARVQLVVMVLPSGKAGCTHGSHHQPGVIACQCGARCQTCRTDDAVSDAHACSQRQAPRAHRQYPCGFESCKGCCGAVAHD